MTRDHGIQEKYIIFQDNSAPAHRAKTVSKHVKLYILSVLKM